MDALSGRIIQKSVTPSLTVGQLVQLVITEDRVVPFNLMTGTFLPLSADIPVCLAGPLLIAVFQNL